MPEDAGQTDSLTTAISSSLKMTYCFPLPLPLPLAPKFKPPLPPGPTPAPRPADPPPPEGGTALTLAPDHLLARSMGLSTSMFCGAYEAE